jgi:hypothetical protein
MSTKKVIVKDDVKYGWKLVTMKPSDYSWFLQEQRYERFYGERWEQLDFNIDFND